MKLALPIFALLGGLQVTAPATTLIVGSSAETTLNEFSPNNNMGGHIDFHAGLTNTGARRRALITFDTSSIPSNAVVTSASISLTVPDGNTAGTPDFDLHMMLTAWQEGDKVGNNGEPAGPGEATWNTSGIGPWGAPGSQSGTDYVDISSASTTVSGFGSYTWASSGLLNDVQGWINGSADNNGWILIEKNEVTYGSARRFSAGGDPTLTVEYTVVPEPGSAALVGLSGFACFFRRRR